MFIVIVLSFLDINIKWSTFKKKKNLNCYIPFAKAEPVNALFSPNKYKLMVMIAFKIIFWCMCILCKNS